MPSLRSALDSLAQSFANGVLAAIRGASLDDLLAEGGAPRRGPGRPRGGGTRVGNPKRTKGGRLARRSAEDIAKTLAQIVALVKNHKAGMRSEDIRKALRLDVREVPRVLAEALKGKNLRKKGEKRATVYFAK
jgi:hypothetical protein